MKRIKLTRAEQAIEKAAGQYVNASKAEFDAMAEAIAHRRKDAVLSIWINSYDLKAIKGKAKCHGIKYQAFISELLHRLAHS